jgi:hypothetical protein
METKQTPRSTQKWDFHDGWGKALDQLVAHVEKM